MITDTLGRFYFLAVLSLIIFRYTEPDLKRPYRVWLSTPILFCMVALFLCTTPFIEAPVESLIALSFVLLAIPIWFGYVKYREALSKGWDRKCFHSYFRRHTILTFYRSNKSVQKKTRLSGYGNDRNRLKSFIYTYNTYRLIFTIIITFLFFFQCKN